MDCILLHGWGASNTVWQGFAKNLSGYKNISTPCLYKLTLAANGNNFMPLAVEINKDIKSDVVIIAWSMGGLVATCLAGLTNKVKAIVFIASTPCFLNKKGWGNAIDDKGFADLKARLTKDTKGALEYFAGLIAHGDASMKETNKIMRNNLTSEKNQAILFSWLGQMKLTDQRKELLELNIPVLFILGKNDSLINSSLAEELKTLNSDIACEVIAGCGHAPFISKQKSSTEIIKEFINAKLG